MSERESGETVAEWVAALVARLPEAHTPEFQQRLAERQAERTDPWRWYCRLCGAEGESEDRVDARGQAYAHTGPGERCGRGKYRGESEAGRLLHVWTYGRMHRAKEAQ